MPAFKNTPALVFAATVAVAFLLVVIVGTLSAAPADAAKLRAMRPAHLRARQSGNACADNITSALHDLVDAAEDVVRAAFTCPDKNKTAECIADITEVSHDLLAAAKRVDEAVAACGGQGSQCAQALLAAGSEITDAASKIALAVAACENKEPLRCIQDVTETALDIEELVGSIRKAAVTCGKGPQPPRAL